MRKIAFVRRGLIAVLSAMLAVAAFFAGRLTAQEEYRALAEADADPASGEALQVPASAYLLKKQGDSLVVVCGTTVIAAFGETFAHMTADEVLRLEEGLAFDSLSDIESFLEGYDS